MYPSVITSSEPCSTPPGVDEQVRSDRLSVSHKESSVPSVQLEYTDTGQVGPANSARVYDRFYPDTLPILPTPTDSNITRQSCTGDTRSTGTGQERGYSRDNCLCNQFHLPDFPGQEKRGGQRPVLNLKALNQFVQVEHFKIEGLHLLPDLIQREDWMIKLDLKDAYLQVPVHEAHQCFLQFAWEGKQYKFQCLPFGLSSAPRVFTKLLKPVVGLLRQIGLRLIIYLDDMLFMHANRDQLEIIWHQ